ncbi:RNA polymerase sigma factor [Flavobacteriaceae bacterium M23B6Z8]
MKEGTEHVCAEPVYQKIFREHAKNLRNFIYYKCGDADKAADIVQEAFVKLWQKCSTVPPEKAKSFLFTVANNLFLNDVAHQKVVLNYQSGDHKSSTNENPEYLMELQQFDDKLQKAINNLSEAQREAFLMNRIDGKKYAEIAELLNISVKAVEKRIHGALKSLREDLIKI